jgi:hypothetical protein
MASKSEASCGEPKQSSPDSQSLDRLQRPPSPERSPDAGGGSVGGTRGGPFGWTTSELGRPGSRRGGASAGASAGTGRSTSNGWGGSPSSDVLQAAPTPTVARARAHLRSPRIGSKIACFPGCHQRQAASFERSCKKRAARTRLGRIEPVEPGVGRWRRHRSSIGVDARETIVEPAVEFRRASTLPWHSRCAVPPCDAAWPRSDMVSVNFQPAALLVGHRLRARSLR